MLAVALCVGLFAYWTVVGYAAVTALHASRSRLQDLLLAPAVGLAVTVIPLFTLSRCGLPVRVFGIPLAVAMLVGAGLLLWRTRPGLPWGRAWPFGVMLLLALGATGQPMVMNGFNWLSYCNDDMANYALAGDRFYYYGYFDYPKPDDVIRGRYFGNDFWFMHVATNTRPGCELTLAWVKSLTRLNEHQSFMPVILSYHLGLLCAAAALVVPAGGAVGRRGDPDGPADPEAPEDVDESDDLRGDGPLPRLRRWMRQGAAPALLTMALLAASALTSLGTLYQLIAQVAGLMLLAANAALLLRPLRGVTGWRLVRHGLLLGLTGAGLLIVYPEVSPFLGIAWFGYLLVGLVRRRIAPGPTALVVGVALLVSLLVTRKYFFDSTQFLFTQARSATSKVDTTNNVHVADEQATLFPYYLLPEGLGDFWGFLRLAKWEDEPYQSWAIGGGGVLLVLALLATAWLCWRGRPVAFVAAGMFALAALLFKQRAGFGLFKLAMYVQPFVLGTVVVGWVTLLAALRRRVHRIYVPVTFLRVVPLFLLGYFGLYGQRLYVGSSYGSGVAFLEIRDPTRTKVASEFRKLMDAHPGASTVISDTYNIVLAKFQALYTRGRETVFPSRPFFTVIDYAAATKWKYLDAERAKVAQDLAERRAAQLLVKQFFDLHDPAHPDLKDEFFQCDLGRTAAGAVNDDALLVMTTPQQSILNRRRMPPGVDGNFVAVPYREARDHLIFVASEMGAPYYSHGSADLNPSLYQLENDPLFFYNDTMTALGRYLLFQAINPSSPSGKVRLAIDMTCSYQNDSKNELPAMDIVGAQRTRFPVTGRGSMRVFSPPVEPQVLDGRSYVLVDMNTVGRKIGSRRTGLMNLFGKKVSNDRRVIVGFTRDIALVSEADYEKLSPPSRLDQFPFGDENPLRNKDLEYCGLYEDGWVSEDAYVRLTQPAGSDALVVTGEVDESLGQNGTHRAGVVLSVDDQVVSRATIGLKEFRIQATVPPTGTTGTAGAGTVRKIRLQFVGPLLHLSGPDNRPVAAHLKSIGFQPPAPVAQSR